MVRPAMLFSLVFVIAPCLLIHDVTALPSTPHIIFMVADDLGYNDVEWNNAKMKTPFMNDLATNGIILDKNYVYPLCTPSRVAFMTGRYPHKVGLQHKTISATQPNYVPLQFDLLPKKLKEQNYTTHMIGKWHLGFCNTSLTPTERGFDSFFGFYNGGEDYYNQEIGLYRDFRWDLNRYDLEASSYNSYSTLAYAERADEIIRNHANTTPDDPLFLYVAFQAPHNPLQVPSVYEDEFDGIVTDATRKTFSGMVLAMDDAIGSIVLALNETGMLDKAVIAFTSDNGGQPNKGGNNYPLRGTKGTYWDGGTRVPGFIYSKTELSQTGYTSDKIFHATDWYATFLNLAGGDAAAENLDGMDQWSTLSNNGAATRTSYVVNFDTYETPSFKGIRDGSYKLMKGDPGSRNSIYTEPARKRRSTRVKRQRSHTYLFDLDADPDESFNLYDNSTYRSIRNALNSLLNTWDDDEVSAIYPANTDTEAHDAAMADNDFWSSGWCTT